MEKINRMNECWYCKNKRSLSWSAHIQCAKPDDIIEGEPHGIKNGWFNYPVEFDPVWKKYNCPNFEWNGKKPK